jgi:hypothetical protein
MCQKGPLAKAKAQKGIGDEKADPFKAGISYLQAY